MTAAARLWALSPTFLGEADEFLREELCADVYHATHVGVQQGKVAVRTPMGICLMVTTTHQGAKLVVFDHLLADGSARRRFWYNAGSIGDLGNRLRTLPRVNFGALLAGASF